MYALYYKAFSYMTEKREVNHIARIVIYQACRLRVYIVVAVRVGKHTVYHPKTWDLVNKGGFVAACIVVLAYLCFSILLSSLVIQSPTFAYHSLLFLDLPWPVCMPVVVVCPCVVVVVFMSVQFHSSFRFQSKDSNLRFLHTLPYMSTTVHWILRPTPPDNCPVNFRR